MELKDRILLLQDNKSIYFDLSGEIAFSEDTVEKLEEVPHEGKLNFSNIEKLRLGVLGEMYAQYIFQSFEYKIFPSVVDDHGVDLIISNDKAVYKVQVKTVKRGGYVYFPQNSFDKNKGKDFFITYIRIENDGTPKTYIFPSSCWKNSLEKDWNKNQFVYHRYSGCKSKSEYGIYGSELFYKNNEFCISTDDVWKLDKEKFEAIIKNCNQN